MVERFLRVLADGDYRPDIPVGARPRLHDIQRTITYALGAIVPLFFVSDPVQLATTIAIALSGLVPAFLRAVRDQPGPPVATGVLDIPVVTVLVAAATGSWLVTVAALVAVAMATHRLVEVEGWVTAVASGVSAAMALPVAIVFHGAGIGAGPAVWPMVLATGVVSATTGVLLWLRGRASSLEGELRSSRRRLETIMRSAPLLVARFALDGELLSAGGPVADRLAVMSIHSIPGVANLVADAAHGRQAEATVGSPGLWLSARATPSPASGPADHVDFVAYDITSQIEAHRELERLNQTKDAFVASVSHELRTPLTAIVGFAADSLDRWPSMTLGDLQDTLAIILEQGRDMADTVEDLLVAVRAGLDEVTVLRTPVGLRRAAMLVATAAERRFGRPITVEGPRVEVVGDETRVRQIIRNLVSNAVQHGGDRIEIEVGYQSAAAFIEVRDSGAPIPDDRRRAMFGLYEGATRSGLTNSLGVGLSVTTTLANLMGGTVTYLHCGEWSRFRVALPTHSVHVSRAS